MLSFKNWRQFNENFGPIAIGLGQPTVLAGPIGATGASEVEGESQEETVEDKDATDLEEGKKCCNKKMIADDSEIEDDAGVEVSDDAEEEEEDPKTKKSPPKEKGDEEGEGESEEEEECEEPPEKVLLMKKKQKKQQKKQMAKEQEEWWNSVHSMTQSDPNPKFWDGLGEVPKNPQPGEPGYAPQGRVGW